MHTENVKPNCSEFQFPFYRVEVTFKAQENLPTVTGFMGKISNGAFHTIILMCLELEWPTDAILFPQKILYSGNFIRIDVYNNRN